MLFGWGMQAACYHRVVRGDSFYHDLRYDRYAYRTRDLPNDCNDIIGFRVVVPNLCSLGFTPLQPPSEHGSRGGHPVEKRSR